MAWYERGYNQTGGGSGGGGGWGGSGGGQWGGGDLMGRIARVLNWSFPIGTYLGIAVRVHITFLLMVIWALFPNPIFGAQWLTILFLSVLLHEFGHCLGCRSVGGQADNILMWPLGGLAFTAPPRRIWPEFVTVAAGPLVSLMLAVIGYVGIVVLAGIGDYPVPVSFNPFDPWTSYPPSGHIAGPIFAHIFVVNWFLLLFNMALVFYPFDGGRLVQIGLWTLTDYYTSMRWAVRVGMAGAVGLGLFGLFAPGFNLLLILIAASGFYACYQQGWMLKAEGADEPWRRSLDLDSQSEGLVSRWKHKREQKKAEKAAAKKADLEKEVDRILAKVGEHGLHSLTGREKKILQQATDEKKG